MIGQEEFPVDLKKIDRFEKQNNYAINVFGYEDSVYPLRISNREVEESNIIDLLLISERETNHYCWIKNLSRLLSKQMTNHNGERYICRRCLISFRSDESLQKHREYCQNHGEIKVEMPSEGEKYLNFKNCNRKMRVPFVIYADFESFTERIDTCSPHNEKRFINKCQSHKPSGFCYYIKSFDDSVYKSRLVQYTAYSPYDDVSQKFINWLEKDIKNIYKKTKLSKKVVNMTREGQINYNDATHCHICEGELGEDKVLDHCHLTGKYRGAAHNECNLNYKIPKLFPVIFHNLSGYDSHLFIKKLGKSKGKLNCIASNEEKYISFTKKFEVKLDIRFIDSFKFMDSSLDTLASNLSRDSFNNTKNSIKVKS